MRRAFVLQITVKILKQSSITVKAFSSGPVVATTVEAANADDSPALERVLNES